MERSGAAEGEQHEIPQVVAPRGRDRLDGLLHLDVDDADDSLRGLRDRHAEGVRDFGYNRLTCAFGIEPHAAAEKIVGAQIAKRKIAVRDGGQFTAAVAGGSWHRAGALRPDLDFAEGVDPRDGP